MKLKKRIILFGTVCILNTMAIGCGSATEATVKTEETQSDEILPEEETDALIKDDDKGTDESQENTAYRNRYPLQTLHESAGNQEYQHQSLENCILRNHLF